MDSVDYARRQVLTFMPGEICVVVSSTQDIVGPSATQETYERLGASLYLVTMHEDGRLPSPRLLATHGQVQPWVVFHPTDRRPYTRALFFYLLPGYPGEPAVLKDDDPRVRDLVAETVDRVGRANGEILAASKERRLSSFDGIAATVSPELTIRAFTPNWLLGPHAWEITPGPAGPPAPAPGATFSAAATSGEHAWEVRNARLKSDQGYAESQPAIDQPIVAVLDTSPTADYFRTAHLQNWLLDTLRQTSPSDAPFVIDGPLSVRPDYFSADPILSQAVPRWRDHFVNARDNGHLGKFAIADHGLAAAGIVRSLAKSAEIQLIRVLSDHGVGDLISLTSRLELLAAQQIANPSRKLVVNLSLGAALPLDYSLEDRLDHVSLQDAVDSLDDSGALLVAAAGNDAHDGPFYNFSRTGRPDPRLPARFDSVLGVGSIRQDGQASVFSNRADAPVIGNAVATFGGNTTGAPPVTDTSDAVVVVYTAAEFGSIASPAAPPTTNTTGWAYWSGTSFATPVVSALASNCWTRDSGLSNGGVIAYITARAQDSVSPTESSVEGELKALSLTADDVCQLP